jgi:hypothetical protein
MGNRARDLLHPSAKARNATKYTPFWFVLDVVHLWLQRTAIEEYVCLHLLLAWQWPSYQVDLVSLHRTPLLWSCERGTLDSSAPYAPSYLLLPLASISSSSPIGSHTLHLLATFISNFSSLPHLLNCFEKWSLFLCLSRYATLLGKSSIRSKLCYVSLSFWWLLALHIPCSATEPYHIHNVPRALTINLSSSFMHHTHPYTLPYVLNLQCLPHGPAHFCRCQEFLWTNFFHNANVDRRIFSCHISAIFSRFRNIVQFVTSRLDTSCLSVSHLHTLQIFRGIWRSRLHCLCML